jgi:hypothetical protein
MGLFKKKPDPISERAKLLNGQIAALEAEIQKLAEQKPTPPPAASHSPFAALSPSPTESHSSGHPRLRSTARPRGHGVPAAVHEPVFEEVGQDRIKSGSEPAPPSNHHELDVRKDDLASAWDRLKTHFRGPVASNPKLVHYLSAGSIQGLRPLRYEKRVARNRFIVLAVILVVVLLGIVSLFFRRN